MTMEREKELIQIAKDLTCSDTVTILNASAQATAIEDLSELCFLRGITVGIRIGRTQAQDDAVSRLIGVGR